MLIQKKIHWVLLMMLQWQVCAHPLLKNLHHHDSRYQIMDEIKLQLASQNETSWSEMIMWINSSESEPLEDWNMSFANIAFEFIVGIIFDGFCGYEATSGFLW